MDNNQEAVSAQRRQRRRFTKAEKQQHLSAWQDSGLSAAQYGIQHGLEAHHLYVWRRQVKNGDEPEATKSLFVPVRLSAPSDSTGRLSVTLRHRDLEFVVSGVDSTGTLVTTLRAITREVLDV